MTTTASLARRHGNDLKRSFLKDVKTIKRIMTTGASDPAMAYLTASLSSTLPKMLVMMTLKARKMVMVTATMRNRLPYLRRKEGRL